MKVAVTGASGFIGQYVCQELVRRGIEVVAVRRMSSMGSMINAKLVTSALPIDYAMPTVEQLDEIVACDALIHLAWGGLPNYGSYRHFEVELPQQYQFLKQLIERGLSSLFVAGTCFEYGMQSGRLSEEVSAQPINPYGFAKYTLYQQLSYLQQAHSFNMQWGRLFYTYGEGQAPSSLYALLQKAIAQGDEFFPMSGGEQLRDFLPVDEMARIIVQIAISRQNLGVMNVCSGLPTSVRRLVEKWIKEQHASIQLNLGHYPYSSFEPMAFWGCTTKLYNLLHRMEYDQ